MRHEAKAAEDARVQAEKIVSNLKAGSINTDADKEIVALIAYLQRLGTDIKAAPKNPGTSAANASQTQTN